MPRRTLREYLCIPNPKLTILKDAAGASAAECENWAPVQDWELWKEFCKDVERIFGGILDLEFELADPPPLPCAQQHIRDERSFEFVLIRWNNVISNEALHAACDYLELTRITWTVGTSVLSYKGDIIRPDWAAVTDDMFIGGSLRASLVPGDTKFIGRDLDETHAADAEVISQAAQLDSDGFAVSSPVQPMIELRRAWMEQVSYYAFRYGARYCYVISNQELLLLRRAEDLPVPPSISIARTRERRSRYTSERETTPTPTTTSAVTLAPVSPSGTRTTGRMTTMSSTTAMPSTTVMPSSPPEKDRADPLKTPSFSLRQAVPLSSSPLTEQHQSSPYIDDGNPEVTIELLSIAWNDEGLTVNLALFALHMLALVSGDVKFSYPRLCEDPAYHTFNRKRS